MGLQNDILQPLDIWWAVVIVITYLSLIVGELAPKRIALNNPERVAMMIAKPMRTLSTMALPLVQSSLRQSRRLDNV